MTRRLNRGSIASLSDCFFVGCLCTTKAGVGVGLGAPRKTCLNLPRRLTMTGYFNESPSQWFTGEADPGGPPSFKKTVQVLVLAVRHPQVIYITDVSMYRCHFSLN